jgi:hypothetical protein
MCNQSEEIIMGGMQSLENADMVATGQISLDEALRYQLECNHYPPVHRSFIPSAKKAIAICQQGIDEDNPKLYQTLIEMPNGRTLTAEAIVSGLHLDYFLTPVE